MEKLVTMEMEKLQYPIGKHIPPDTYTLDLIDSFIATLEKFPSQLREETAGLSDEQLDTPYRLAGWTIRQVVHHCADSHMNSIIRFKLALTEDVPTIKPYFEDRWAELADTKNYPIETSLMILDGVHMRLTALLRSLNTEQLDRTFIHPSHGKEISLKESMSIYAWHSRHHLAHITELKRRMEW